MNLVVASVLVPCAAERVFDYLVPDGIGASVGTRVLVNFRGTSTVGIIRSLASHSDIPFERLKKVIRAIDPRPLADGAVSSMSRHISQEYFVSEGEALKLFLPAFLGRKEIVFSERTESAVSAEQPASMTFCAELPNGDRRFGLYRERIDYHRSKGKSCLVCVPTVEDISFVRSRLPDYPWCEYASSLSAAEMKRVWPLLKSGTVPFCLGTRSAFFILPESLGLIIIEDCFHEGYAHPERPFYRIAELAQYYARLRRAEVIMQGQSPSLRLQAFIRRNRVAFKDFRVSRNPAVRIVEQHRAVIRKGQIISPFISDTIQKGIAAKEKMLIVYSKQGFSASVACSSCKQVIQCKRCSIPLKYYSSKGVLLCPKCRFSMPYQITCPQCGKGYLKSRGMGVEKLRSLLQRFFPEVVVDPLEKPFSGDAAQGSVTVGAFSEVGKSGQDRQWDTVLVFDIDALFYRLDHDTTWRVFTLLRQLKSLARRELIVISALAEHYALQSLHHDDEWFYAQERLARRDYSLPPYFRAAKITIRSLRQKTAEEKADALAALLSQETARARGPVTLSGPVPEMPFKLRDQYYYSIIVTARNRRVLQDCIRSALRLFSRGRTTLAIIPRYE